MTAHPSALPVSCKQHCPHCHPNAPVLLLYPSLHLLQWSFCTDKTRTAHKPPPASAPSPKFELILISGPAVFTETQKWKQKLEMGDTFSIPAFSSMLCRHRLQHKASIMIMLQLESILDPSTLLCCQLLFHSKAAPYSRGEDKVWK